MANLLSMGAVLWDIYGDKKAIGGAPFNLAAHAKALGMDSYIYTSLGKDDLGSKAFEFIKTKDVQTDYVQFDEIHPTGTATVMHTQPGIPSYDIPFEVAYNYININDNIISDMKNKNFDYICFGTMEQKSPRSKEAIQRVLTEVPAKHVFFDVNFRIGFYDKEVMDFSLKNSTIIKINEDEVRISSKLLFNKELSYDDFAKLIKEKYNIKIILVTLGPKGCIIYSDGQKKILPTFDVEVTDTVGAGDAFSAAFINKFEKTDDPFISARFGNLLGSFVASKLGAIPELSVSELEKIEKNNPSI